jgi:hypothetical protein
MTILDLGLRDYEEVWRLQKEFVARRRAGEIPDTVILVEHPPVFTIGRQPDAEASGDLSPGPSPKEGGEFPFPLGKGLGVRSACFSTLPSAEPADSSAEVKGFHERAAQTTGVYIAHGHELLTMLLSRY